MRGHQPKRGLELPNRRPRRLEPTDYFSGLTLAGALLTVSAGDVAATLFLAATFMAMRMLRRRELPTAFEFCFAIGIVLQGWGNALLLFERVGWYDKAVHFLTPMLVVPSLYLLLARAGAVRSPFDNDLRRGTLGLLVVATALGTALATIWELVEGSADRWLGTSFAHGYFETIDDLYASVLGSAAGGALLVWFVVARGRDLAATRVGGEALAEAE